MCSIKEMTDGIQNVAKTHLPKGGHIYLYGSRARGDAKSTSDWDILILLDKERISNEDFNTVAYPLVELGWKLNSIVSPQLYTISEWQRMSFMPYHKNVEREKIVLV